MILEFVQPNCAIGGIETRVNAFMVQGRENDGVLGIGETDCRKPELLHELSDNWMSMWYLYYPGTYTICHKPAATLSDPRPYWREQTKVHLLEPTPEHCS